MACPALWRADLLRALASAGDEPAAQQRLALRLGFEAEPVAVESKSDIVISGERQITGGPAPSVVVTRRLDGESIGATYCATLYGVSGRIRLEQATTPSAPARMLEPSDCLPRLGQGHGPWLPLVRSARLWPALRQSVSRMRPAGIDVPTLSAHLARARPVRRVPRIQRRTWSERLWVVQDIGDAMRPYQGDMHQLLVLLQRLRGPGGLQLWQVRDVPEQVEAVYARSTTPAQWASLTNPPAGTTVLVLGHLGLLARHPASRERWLRMVQRWRECGARPLAWGPVSGAWVDASLALALPVHCLQAPSGLQPQRGRRNTVGSLPHLQAAPLVDELLVLAACCVHLAPDLLRALRRLDPALRNEPGLEGLAWTDRRVGRSLVSRPLTSQGINELRQRFDSLPAARQREVLLQMRRYHGHHGRTTEAAEALIWQSHARPEAQSSQVDDWCAAAERLLGAVSASATGRDDLLAFAQELLVKQGGDAQWLGRHRQLLTRLQAVSNLPEVPQGLDAAQVQRERMALPLPPGQDCRLVQRGADLWLWPGATMLPQRASPIGPTLRAAEVLVAPAQGPAQRFFAAAAPCRLLRLRDDALPLQVYLDGEALTIDAMPRPTWADEWGRDADGLYAMSPPLGRHRQRFGLEELGAGHLLLRDGEDEFLADHLPVQLDGAQIVLGIDRAFGVFADLTVAGVTQRLRWIAPGEFWMGSSDEERARIRDADLERWARNESPRHRVRLSEGFWLADSACTQALWLAVMGGKNPSRFDDDLRCPVEDVSWDDAQAFLGKLQELLPAGVQAVLPSEAQWEYACRAGTTTAFNLGDAVTSAQVNYNGNRPYGDAAEGEYRWRTVPVKSLPANGWGLYEMHGNVWEWCADGLREYERLADGEAVVDPLGPQEQGRQALRAVRGGSWFDLAWIARSAFRNQWERGDRSGYQGFRLCLRSTSPGAPEGPGGLGPDPEAKALPARRDAGPARDGEIGLLERGLRRLRDLTRSGRAPGASGESGAPSTRKPHEFDNPRTTPEPRQAPPAREASPAPSRKAPPKKPPRR